MKKSAPVEVEESATTAPESEFDLSLSNFEVESLKSGHHLKKCATALGISVGLQSGRI
jgi:hypothetical protein